MTYSDLDSKNPKIKYACSKEIIRISKENPKKLVKDYEFFIKLLKSDNNIFKWTAINAIGGITSVTGSKKDLKLLISYLNKGKLIIAGHAMDALAQISITKPEFRNKIINELLKVPKYKYDSKECNIILCSRLIATLDKLSAKGKKIEDFLKTQLKSKRSANIKRAKRLLKKIRNAP